MTALTRLLPWSIGRLSRRTPVEPTPPAPAAARLVTPDDAEAQPAELAERRAQALRSMFPMLYSLCARRADLWRAIAIERYLSQATNITDLELRIVEVQRQTHFGCSA